MSVKIEIAIAMMPSMGGGWQEAVAGRKMYLTYPMMAVVCY